MLQPLVSQPVFLDVKPPAGAQDQIFISVKQLPVCWWGASFWWEDVAGPHQRSYSWVWVQWNSWPDFTLSDLRLPQPGGPGPCIYIPQEKNWPSYTPRHGAPFSPPPATHRSMVKVFESASIGGSLSSTNFSHWSSLYNLGMDCIEYTASSSSSVFAYWFATGETCLPRRCLAMAVSVYLNIPDFSHRVTIFFVCSLLFIIHLASCYK
jgi:hypothetical protein